MKNSEIQLWAIQQLHISSSSVTAFYPISGDASFRRYFRLQQEQQSWIVVDSPPAQEKNYEFVAIAKAYLGQGIKVPKIISTDYKQGYLLLEDLGDKLFLDTLTTENCLTCYQQAIQLLPNIQQVTRTELKKLPEYNQSLLLQEMQLFIDWFLLKFLKLIPSSSLTQQLIEYFYWLIDHITSQPFVGVHRDFHSRNLMYFNQNKLAVIDFQDAVFGPITYDLVSLLCDSYFVCPKTVRTQLIIETFEQWGLQHQYSLAQFQQQFDVMAMQRQLKIVGIFCRLWLRDGKDNYLKDVQVTLTYLQQIASCYPESQWLATIINHSWLEQFQECYKQQLS